MDWSLISDWLYLDFRSLFFLTIGLGLMVNGFISVFQLVANYLPRLVLAIATYAVVISVVAQLIVLQL